MDIDEILVRNPGVVLYFTAEHCNVCKTLKPAISEMLSDHFLEMKFYEIDTQTEPELAAKFQACSIPLILVYFEGKEFFRKGRAVSVNELSAEISRPYAMLFGSD